MVARPASASLDAARQHAVLRRAQEAAQGGTQRQGRITLAPLDEEENGGGADATDSSGVKATAAAAAAAAEAGATRRPSLPDPHLSAPVLPPIRAKRRERAGEDIRYLIPRPQGSGVDGHDDVRASPSIAAISRSLAEMQAANRNNLDLT